MAGDETTEGSEEEIITSEEITETDEPNDSKVDKGDDWQTKARKHERTAKRERKAREDAERKLKERESEDQSDHEKAVEKAREEARAEAKAEADKERRSDRLEVSVTRLATRGIKIGDGDGAETMRFADSDDALLHLERAMSRGDVDADDIFDSDGRPDNDAVVAALAEILEGKPHLRASNGEPPKPKGSGDAGKGKDAAKGVDDLTAEEHFQRIRRHK